MPIQSSVCTIPRNIVMAVVLRKLIANACAALTEPLLRPCPVIYIRITLESGMLIKTCTAVKCLHSGVSGRHAIFRSVL